MPRFAWEGTTRAGEQRRGVIEADSRAVVEERLKGDNIAVKKIAREGGLGSIEIQIGTGIGAKDLQIFTRQLATMIDAGLPLVQCLDILANQTENKSLKKVLQSVKNSVEQGATFSDALKKHPKVFDELFTNLVAAGEVGGILDTILNRLAVYIEKAVKLKNQLKSAMFYPNGIPVGAIRLIANMPPKVNPVLGHMYKEKEKTPLPKPTMVVIGISHSFLSSWYIYAGIIIGTIFAITSARRTVQGKEITDRALLRMPIIGPVLRKIVVARFTRTLGTLLSSGVPILDALEICARTAGNAVVQKAILGAREKISQGSDMQGPLAESKVFPTMVVQMIGVGEQTGAMDQMLNKIADFYEEEVDAAVAGLTSLIEPVMMAFLGVVVGGLIVAMYLPIFNLAGTIG